MPFIKNTIYWDYKYMAFLYTFDLDGVDIDIT